MTCIVGLVHEGQVYMGADSAAIDEDSNVMVRLDRKLFRKGEFIIGFAGSYRMGQVLQYRFSPPDIHGDLMAYMVTKFIPAAQSVLAKNDVEAEPSLLVGIRDRLFLIDSDFQVAEHACGYAAIGIGSQYAYGAFFALAGIVRPTAQVECALRASARFNASVAEPFYYENT